MKKKSGKKKVRRPTGGTNISAGSKYAAFNPVESEVSLESTNPGDALMDTATMQEAKNKLKRALGFGGFGGGIGIESFSAGIEPFGAGNVVAIGWAEKQRGGVGTGELALTTIVERKADVDELGPNVIESLNLGVPTDVIEGGRIKLQQGQVPCGSSVQPKGHSGWSNGCGTIACLCSRNSEPSTLYLLSNKHVLAPHGFDNRNTSIHTCDRSQRIGELRYWSKFNPNDLNVMDAAIARTGPDVVTANHGPWFTVDPNPIVSNEYYVGMQVKKFGATTGATDGILRGWDFEFSVPYPSGTFWFTNQLWFEADGGGAFTQPGDSGSLVVTRSDNRPVGLHFAGDGGRNSYSNPIEVVLQRFGLDVVDAV